jgi:hypothetical protein
LTPKLPNPHIQPVGWLGIEKNGFLKNTLLDKGRVLNSKCPEYLADKGVLKKIVVHTMQDMGSRLERLSQMKFMSLV